MSVALRIGPTVVARYDSAPRRAGVVPRPVLHPVHTRAGRDVTDAEPADHAWHRGMGIGLPDVNGVNLWGGPCYLRDVGYVSDERCVHGSVSAAGPAADDDALRDRLEWRDEAGVTLLTEQREIRVQALGDDGYALDWSSTLQAAGRTVLRSPGSNGRAGAGYGGWFWRLPGLPHDEVRVRTEAGADDEQVNGARAPWVAVTVHGGSGWTAVLVATDPRTAADPWFVRVAGYLGVGSALCWDRPLVLAAGEQVHIGLRVMLVDRVCDLAEIDDLVQGRDR